MRYCCDFFSSSVLSCFVEMLALQKFQVLPSLQFLKKNVCVCSLFIAPPAPGKFQALIIKCID